LNQNNVKNYVRDVAKKWIIDTSALHYFCAQREWFKTYNDLVTNVNTAGPSIQSKGVGTVKLPIGNYEIALQNIIYMLNLQLNILSAKRLKKDNCIRYSN
jgi:hypothetical protein